ncbi:uncharacterized protein LOC106172989 [Lingula anatina]|uniref:Uncharacterized protein LOC106172989 n=1 Tax=Lingula anatina TaxID=7574 RepID=A0A2R2MKX8_LINAN|nr:uncharacterized protein LOC106172989 [Lingula anatina]|eukprot:XP_023930855.1 uncharacterized protein LOC106172989 [Lingula anatina]
MSEGTPVEAGVETVSREDQGTPVQDEPGMETYMGQDGDQAFLHQVEAQGTQEEPAVVTQQIEEQSTAESGMEPVANPAAEGQMQPLLEDSADQHMAPQDTDQDMQQPMEPQIDIESDQQMEPPVDVEAGQQMEPQVDVDAGQQMEPPVDVEAGQQMEPQVDVEAGQQMEPQVDVEGGQQMEPQVDVVNDPQGEPAAEEQQMTAEQIIEQQMLIQQMAQEQAAREQLEAIQQQAMAQQHVAVDPQQEAMLQQQQGVMETDQVAMNEAHEAETQVQGEEEEAPTIQAAVGDDQGVQGEGGEEPPTLEAQEPVQETNYVIIQVNENGEAELHPASAVQTQMAPPQQVITSQPATAATVVAQSASKASVAAGQSSGVEVEGEKKKTDHALLRRPIELGVSGVQQVINCIKSGTDEMKSLLVSECHVIFECRVCRNLFRGLPNFIAHKRIYCKDSFRSARLRMSEGGEDELVILQPEGADLSMDDLQGDDDAPPVLVREGNIPRDRKDGKLSRVVELERIPGNSNAVRMKRQGDPEGTPRTKRSRIGRMFGEEYYTEEDLALAEPDQNMTRIRRRTMDGSDIGSPAAARLAERHDVDLRTLACLNCNTTYSSIKTLNFHMQSLHSDTRTFYPCIFCNNVFAQLWGVTRHIMRSHKKSKEEVEDMRETLRQRAFSKTVDEMGEYETPRHNKDVIQKGGDRGSVDGEEEEQDLVNVKSDPQDKGAEEEMEDEAMGEEDEEGRGKSEDVYEFDEEDQPSSGVKRSNSAKKESNSPVILKYSDEDEALIESNIDMKNLICLKCDRQYGSISNLRRHAVRHLGWRRFKCKLCKFMSYNRSECKSHLRRIHTAKMQGQPELLNFVIDLEHEGIAVHSPIRPQRRTMITEADMRKSGYKPERVDDDMDNGSMSQDEENSMEESMMTTPEGFSRVKGSARRSSGKAAPKVDRMTTLVTRSGSYPKGVMTRSARKGKGSQVGPGNDDFGFAALAGDGDNAGTTVTVPEGTTVVEVHLIPTSSGDVKYESDGSIVVSSIQAFEQMACNTEVEQEEEESDMVVAQAKRVNPGQTATIPEEALRKVESGEMTAGELFQLFQVQEGTSGTAAAAAGAASAAETAEGTGE